MTRVVFLCMILLGALLPGSGGFQAQAAERFVSVIEDLPLMDGLRENENAAVAFETAGGRIAEAEARGGIAPARVRGFYAQVLPQLGWTALGEGLYRRERERLKVVVESDGDGGTAVGFSVSPLGK